MHDIMITADINITTDRSMEQLPKIDLNKYLKDWNLKKNYSLVNLLNQNYFF